MTDFAIHVQRIDADAALPLWHAAPHTCVFTHPNVLAALAQDVHWWLATVSGTPASLWPVCIDAAGQVAPPEFAYYLGPFELLPAVSSPRRRLLRSVEIQRGLLDAMTRSYERLTWSTLPGLHDLRPWLWFESPGRRPTVRLRYTAVLDGIAALSDEQIRLRFGKERRYDLRQAMDAGVQLLRSPVTTDRVMELYGEMMTASGAAELGQRRLGEVEALCRLVSQGHGFIVACGLRGDDRPRAIWLTLTAKGRACSVLSAADMAWRERDFNAFGRLCAILAARDAGARCYDFNGANSLQRGSDKHSYGGEADLYFDLSL